MRDGGEWGILLRVGETVPVRIHTTGKTATLTVVDEQHFDPSAGAYEHGWWCEDESLRWWYVSQSGRADRHRAGDGEPGDCLEFGAGAVIRVPERGRA